MKKKSKTIVGVSNAEKVMDLLERSEVLEVSNYLLHNWHLDTLDCDDDEVVFSCSYTEIEEGLTFDFDFTKKALEEAKIIDNSIEMVDTTDEVVEIICYKLVSVV